MYSLRTLSPLKFGMAHSIQRYAHFKTTSKVILQVSDNSVLNKGFEFPLIVTISTYNKRHSNNLYFFSVIFLCLKIQPKSIHLGKIRVV